MTELNLKWVQCACGRLVEISKHSPVTKLPRCSGCVLEKKEKEMEINWREKR